MNRVVLATSVGMAVLLGAVGCSSEDSYVSRAEAIESTPTEPPTPRFELAAKACQFSLQTDEVVLGDAGYTLQIDGEDEYGDGISVERMVCLLSELGVPDRTVAQMDRTRALDGVVEDEWDGIEASWTYHPDDGLDVLLVDTDEPAS